MVKQHNYTGTQGFFLVLLRVFIGWHFLYEGIAKLVNPNWSSVAYLLDSQGFLSGWFTSMAANPETLQVVDFLNIWGLILIGLGLILGLFTRIATIAGIALLALYYLSHPPLPLFNYSTPAEGSYLIINKTLIELVALAVLYVFPTGSLIGIDRILGKIIKK